MKVDVLVRNTFRRRATRLVSLAAVAALVAAVPSVVHAAGPVASLKPGEHVFWDGPYVERATVGAGDAVRRRRAVLDLRARRRARRGHPPARGDRLAEQHEHVRARPVRPLGRSRSARCPATAPGATSCSPTKPAPGTWKVRVVPEDVTASSFSGAREARGAEAHARAHEARARSKRDAAQPAGQRAVGRDARRPGWRSARRRWSSIAPPTCSATTRSRARSTRRCSTARSGACASASGR